MIGKGYSLVALCAARKCSCSAYVRHLFTLGHTSPAPSISSSCALIACLCRTVCFCVNWWNKFVVSTFIGINFLACFGKHCALSELDMVAPLLGTKWLMEANMQFLLSDVSGLESL